MKRFLSLFLALVVAVGICFSAPMTIEAEAASWSSDYKYWSQGASDEANMRSGGCWITADAKMIYETGINRNSSFNPDVLKDWYRANGYISTGGVGKLGNVTYSPVAYAKSLGNNGLEFLGTTTTNTTDKIWSNINNGYYSIAERTDGTHYFLIDNESSKKNGVIWIYDSWSKQASYGPRKNPYGIEKVYTYKYDGGTTPTYTVSYDANGGTGAPAAQTKKAGEKLTLSSTVPTRLGYTFYNWKSSAKGDCYVPGPTGWFSGDYNTTMVAQWAPNTYTISYNANGGSGSMSSHSVTFNTKFNVKTSEFTRSGYKQVGWNLYRTSDSTWFVPNVGWKTASQISSGGYSKQVYALNASNWLFESSFVRSGLSTDTFVFYAVWEKVASYTISYDANGGSGAPASQTKYHDQNLTLSTTKPTRTGYNFMGWGTSTGDTSVNYEPGATYSSNANITLYAIWEQNVYTLMYRGVDGVTNLPANQTKTAGGTITISSQIPVREGYTFTHWRSIWDKNEIYYPGGTYTKDQDMALVSEWKCNHTLNGTTIVNAKDPTYTEEGYTGDTKCNTCEEIIKTGSAISKVVLGVPTVKTTNTTNGVRLTWNAIDGATSYKIFRKKLTGTTWTAWSSPANGITATSYLDKTAKLGETYIYAVSAVNSSVTGSFRQTDAIKCNMTPTVSVANSENYIKVSWNAINGAESYTVFRRAYNDSTKTWGGWSKLKEGYTSTSYNDTLGNLGVTYSYTVVAVNSTLSSNYVSSVSIKCNPTLKPTIKNTTDGIKVEWSKIFGATSYKVFRRELNTTNNTWGGWVSVTTGYTGNAYVDKTAKLGVTYSYAVVGVNSTTSSNYVATSGLKCDIPVTVKVTSTTSGINLSWNKVNGATGYTIYRKAFNATNNTWSSWSVLKTGYTGTSYTDTLGNLGASYIYCVRATVGSFSGSYVQSSSVKCNVVPKTTINNTTNGIKVSWSNVFGATSYKIFRRELNTTNNTWGSWAVVTSGYTGNAFIDKTAKLGVTYSYAVVAVNSTTSSSYIATSGLKCDPTPTVSVSNTQTGVSVKWNAINGAESYIVYRRAYNDSTKEWSKWTSIKKDHKSTSYVDTMGNLGATYNYTVRAVANGEKGSYVSSVSIKCNIPPKVTIANTSTGVKVSWSNVFGATSYKVFRRELNTSTNTWSGWMSPASGLTGSAYIDTTAKLGVTYSYAVVASNSTTSSSYVATSGLKCNMAPTVKIANATNGVKITWNAINGAGSYKIYRKELNTVNNTWSGWMSPASGVTGTSYVDKTAKLGVTYIYTVAAVGNGITSNFVATSALKFDPIPTVTIGTATNGIRVNWNAINGADSYIIYKKTYNAKTGKWGTWTTVAQNYKGTTVVDTSAVNGTYYMYTVRATKGTFNSSFTQSNVVKYVK